MDESDQFVGQICHIEAANTHGERYNQCQTDEERRSPDNLLLLCYKHHKETDNVELYSTERLRTIKLEHESRNGVSLFKIDESLLYKIQLDMQEWWTGLKSAHEDEHDVPSFAVPIDANASFVDVMSVARENVEHVATLAQWPGLPFELAYLALPNLTRRLTEHAAPSAGGSLPPGVREAQPR
ncbi:MAG: hypothetical protein R2991_16605 [Thermoanaerobaculia bacterium]